ncbi:MAG: ABC transporter permease [Gaiellaceae bacterium]
MIQALRVIRIGWVVQLKTMARSGFDILTVIVTPITYASIAFFLYRRGGGAETLLWVSLGAAFMGLWASTLWGAGNNIQRQRSQQTLEFAIAAPTPFLVSLIGTSLASSTVGLYSLVATLAWGRLLFDVPLELAHPVLFAISLPAAVLSLALLGIVMAATLILYRYAWALANMLEYPVWLAAGLLAPIALLPGWVHPISGRARADLGREGRARKRARRCAAHRDRCLPRARGGLPRNRLLLRPELRATRAAAGDARALMMERA